MNIQLSEKLITQLVETHGVKTFCLCPGGRSAPLISVISRIKGIEIFSFFEERSAGFFAMGRCRRDKRPCAVVTTSGTAVAELLPSVIESYYSHLPLVLVTADRPSSYRKTGAPQSIEQPGIFSHYVEQTWDLENDINFDLSSWSRTVPCHINICFDEPLIDGEIRELSFSPSKITTKDTPPCLAEHKWQIKSFFSKVKRPLCILAELPENIRKNIEDTLCSFSWPVYAEALSGLRESRQLQSYILKSGETFLKWLVLNKRIDGVIRIGRRPCTRFWRDLEKSYPHLPVLSVSDQVYSGLSRSLPAVSFSSFFKWSHMFVMQGNVKKQSDKKNQEMKIFFHGLEEVFEKDTKQSQFLSMLCNKYPLSEPALIRQFSRKIPDHSLLFLGNSLPIREWNLMADYQSDKQLVYVSNRGVNGIDGLISTFLGTCSPHRKNWCLIGDLSCLYDLSAPWILRQFDSKMQLFLVIINNSGGQIFSSLFSDPMFLNSHNLRFKQWAKMWNLNYYHITQWPEIFSFSSPAVIELQVNPLYAKQFEKEYK